MKVQIQKRGPIPHIGRPREFNEEVVLAAAANAFWEKGYFATSIDDLCAATGILRGSLYGAYGDKRGIFLAALAYYSDQRIHRLAESPAGVPPGREVLLKALLYYVDAAFDLNRMRGCFITNTALELAPQDPDVALLIGNTFHCMASLWAKAAALARAKGSSAPDDRAVGNYLLCIVQGLRVMGKINNSEEIAQIVEIALRVLEIE